MAWNIANKLQAIYDTLTMVVKESFDEGDLSTNSFTPTGTYSKDTIGIGITNNSESNALTLAIGTVSVVVPVGSYIYEVFTKPSPLVLEVTGTSPDFDAYIKG